MRSSSTALRLILAGAICLAPTAAWGLINPNFTPIHLTEQSDAILKIKLTGANIGAEAAFKVQAAMKGKAPAKVTLSLTDAPEQHAKAARKHLAACAADTALLFYGTYDDKKLGYLHAGGKWLRLTGGDADKWRLEIISSEMECTWAGGTDMLARCVQYIIDSRGDATVPVDAGMDFRSIEQVGQIKGKATRIAAVDLAGDGKLCLYVASAGGDRLLRAVAGKDKFDDITARVRLSAKSVASAWGDFNADGRADLASFDGKVLTLWNQQADGTFTAAKAGGKFTIPAKCPPLATVAGGKGAPPALVVSGVSPARLLTVVGKNTFKQTALPVSKNAPKKWGAPQGCLVGDFNNDRVPDIIQPFETGGMLFPGKAGGGFAAGKPCGVGFSKGGGVSAMGDFDADGLPDIIVGGAEGMLLFHNLGGGKFAETLRKSGEISYKGQPFASCITVGDFSSDARQDVIITYSTGQTLMYFNRGFRSFGEAAPQPEGRLADIDPENPGQDQAILADFDNDGAQDLVLVSPKGVIRCAFNDLGGEMACIKVRLPAKAPTPGPVAVTLWQGKRCLGVQQVVAHDRPAFFGIEDTDVFTLKWQLPGGKAQTRKVTVEDEPVEVVIPAK